MERNECHHGQLARQCPLCEKDSEIASLRGSLKRARGLLMAADCSYCEVNKNPVPCSWCADRDDFINHTQ